MASERGNINIEQQDPPPGAVSAFQLSVEAAQALQNPLGALIPWWVWLLGAGACGAVAYGAWRLLEKTGPVLLPMALGVPPTAAFAMSQLGTLGMTATHKPEPTSRELPAAPTSSTGLALDPAAISALLSALPVAKSPELAAILALAPALGAHSSAMAEALSRITSAKSSAGAVPTSRRGPRTTTTEGS